jgi:hypothetical protein
MTPLDLRAFVLAVLAASALVVVLLWMREGGKP